MKKVKLFFTAMMVLLAAGLASAQSVEVKGLHPGKPFVLEIHIKHLVPAFPLREKLLHPLVEQERFPRPADSHKDIIAAFVKSEIPRCNRIP